jgi:uncharacterized protein (DUF697 family)
MSEVATLEAPTSAVSTHRAAAETVVDKYVPWSMGVGFVPVPLFVAAGLTGIQLKMLADVSKVYGVPFSENSARAALLSLIGGIASPALAFGGLGGLVAAVPILGPFLLPATLPLLAGAATFAVGRTFIQHFESGGTYLNFDPAGAKQLFAERFAEGKAHAGKFTSSLNQKVAQVIEI